MLLTVIINSEIEAFGKEEGPRRVGRRGLFGARWAAAAGLSEAPQVVCQKGQQEAADVPVHDEWGEAQDTPGPWQHLGVWKTRVSQNPPYDTASFTPK